MPKMNQIYTILNQAQSQAWGKTAVTVIDTATMIGLGDHIINSSTADSKDLWTKALTDIIGKTIFVNRVLTGNDLGITRDNIEWGAILRKVRVKPKGVEHNEEYDLGAEPYDPFKITTPEVMEQLFSKHTTYKSEITITDKQLFTAFKDDSEMMAFYSLIFKQLEDSIARALRNYDRIALANFIAEKLKLQVSQPDKTHSINLIEAYLEETGKTITADKVYTDPEFLRFFATKVLEYKKYMNADTDIFNSSDGYPSQTPDQYMNFYINSIIDSRLKTYLYADTYHKEMVTIDNYKEVEFWQGIKGATGKSFKPSNTTSINIKPASGGPAIVKSGVLAVMVDKDAIVSTYLREGAESWRVPLKGTNHARNVTHMYINDVMENGLVFYVENLPVKPVK